MPVNPKGCDEIVERLRISGKLKYSDSEKHSFVDLTQLNGKITKSNHLGYYNYFILAILTT